MHLNHSEYQRRRFRGLLAATAAGVAALALLATGSGVRAASDGKTADVPIEQVLAPGLQDLTLTTRPREMNVQELNKIGRDFSNAYRVGRTRIMMKEPNMFRLDANVLFFKVEYIINGKSRVARFPAKSDRDEIGDDPGKRQGPLDVGLITAGSLRGYTVEFVGAGTEAGRPSLCYRLRYAHDTVRYELLWVDSERKCLLRRQCWTAWLGKRKMEYTYLDPQKVGSLFIPTRIEVRNADSKKAGMSEQSEFKVNSGLEDSLFQL